MRICGIDPGTGGGYAIIEDGSLTLAKKSFPIALDVYNLNRIWIEKVTKDYRPSSAVLMENFGRWRTHCDYAGVQGIFEVRPQVWQFLYQKKFPFLRGRTGPRRKAALKEVANRLFPDEKLTLSTCDAALIALYGWQNYLKERDACNEQTSD